MDNEKLQKILKDHAIWLEDIRKGKRANLHSANLQDSDLQDSDLRFANLRSANLESADLQSANLEFADLRSANLESADLRYSDLWHSDLRSANLQSANLQSANLWFANLYSADLWSANLESANLPSPTMVLLANWGSLSDELTNICMHFDASCHPSGVKPFINWANGGPCPYENCHTQRSIIFRESRYAWKHPIEIPSPYEIMMMILREKCKGLGE